MEKLNFINKKYTLVPDYKDFFQNRSTISLMNPPIFLMFGFPG
jgi:hypothetical protein